MKWFVHCYTFSYDLAPEPSAADRNGPKAQISRRGRPGREGLAKGTSYEDGYSFHALGGGTGHGRSSLQGGIGAGELFASTLRTGPWSPGCPWEKPSSGSPMSSEHFNFSPESLGGGSVQMVMTVDDPDAAFERAVAAGATVVWPVSDQYGWRLGRLVDPFGHHWEIGKPLDDGG